MFLADAPEPFLDFVVFRLRTAGWCSRHYFDAENGYIMEWTDHGRKRCVWLQQMIQQYGLTTGAKAKQFTAVCAGRPATENFHPSPIEKDFWRLCLEELEIGMEESSLANLCRAIGSWKPRPNEAAG